MAQRPCMVSSFGNALRSVAVIGGGANRRPMDFVQAVSNPGRCLSSAPTGAATRKARAAG